MKKTFYLISGVAFITLVLFSVSCKESTPEEYCESFEPGCTVQEPANSCCEGDDCYYTYEGKRYECEDIECEEGITELIDDMCSVSVDERATIVKKYQSKLKELRTISKMTNKQ